MQMREADIVKYPHFHRYVSKSLPELRTGHSDVHAAYLKVCAHGAKVSGVEERTVRAAAAAALAWANKPVLLVENIADNGVTDYGTMRITVNADNIQKYEDECRAAAKGKSASTKYATLVQYLLLHELVHWVRRASNLPTAVDLPVGQNGGRRYGSTDPEAKKDKTKHGEVGVGHAVVGRGAAKTVTGEAGDAFERAAYGQDMSGYWALGKTWKWCGSCR